MAYFSNGTDGDVLDRQCDDCMHADTLACCPIAAVQMEFNYTQCVIPELQRAMNMLVRENGRCNMKPLIDKLRAPTPKDLQLELFG